MELNGNKENNCDISNRKIVNKLNNLSILYLNARSIRNKLEEIKLKLSEMKAKKMEIHIIVVCETWLLDDEIKYVNIEGYKGVFNCNEGTQHKCGTAIFVMKDISYEILEMEEKYNTIVIAINNASPKLKIATLYNPTRREARDFIDHLNIILGKYKHMLLLSDTNIDLLTSEKETKEYKEMLRGNGYKIMNAINIANATRVEKSSASLIDHIVSNTKDNIAIKTELETHPRLDHHMIKVQVEKIAISKKPMTSKMIKTYNKNLFVKEVKEGIEADEHISIDQLINIIKKAKENNALTKKVRSRDKPWMDNKEMHDLLKRRKNAYDRSKKHPENEELKKNLKDMMHKVEAYIKMKREEYVEKNIKETSKDGRKLWKALNEAMGKDSKVENSTIEIILENGVEIKENKEIANVMMEYFKTIGEKLAKDIRFSPTGNQNNERYQQ